MDPLLCQGMVLLDVVNNGMAVACCFINQLTAGSYCRVNFGANSLRHTQPKTLHIFHNPQILVSSLPVFKTHSSPTMPTPESFLRKYGTWAVVTGASAGIGAEFALQLGAADLSVALFSSTP